MRTLVLATTLLAGCSYEGEVEPRAPYYMRPVEYEAAVAVCAPLGGLVGVGVIVPEKGPITFKAICQHGKRWWHK